MSENRRIIHENYEQKKKPPMSVLKRRIEIKLQKMITLFSYQTKNSKSPKEKRDDYFGNCCARRNHRTGR